MDTTLRNNPLLWRAPVGQRPEKDAERKDDSMPKSEAPWPDEIKDLFSSRRCVITVRDVLLVESSFG